MKIFSFQFDGSKYSEKPQEDAFSLNQDTFCVADGITRDPIGVSKVEHINSQENKEHYPNPSPAKFASNLFVNEFLNYSKTHSIEESFKFGNRKVKELNQEKNPNPDYLENDFWACVAVSAKIKDHKLNWGVIGDCAIKVFSQDWDLKFETPNSVKIFEKYFFSDANKDLKDFDWKTSKGRTLVRKEFRNNTNKEGSYGALTGEVNLEQGDIVVLYSDGFERTFNHSDFQQKIQKLINTGDKTKFIEWNKKLGESNYDNYGHERTMIILINN
ncbi:MAG: hypothetical protein ABI721_01835 [Candidatus Dojkabacteria bacterium]